MATDTHQQESGDLVQIHLRVPKHVKAQWVEQSRESGSKLSDWIVQQVNARREIETDHYNGEKT
jgi:hypothetical protein